MLRKNNQPHKLTHITYKHLHYTHHNQKLPTTIYTVLSNIPSTQKDTHIFSPLKNIYVMHFWLTHSIE